MNFSDYIKHVRASGHYAFTTSDALAFLGISRNALSCGVYKLKKKNEIVSPAKNLYVIVPPEFQATGCIPAEELLPILMKHWNLPYYSCLLSAAQIHGASHQKPQVFQVMTNKQIKMLHCGKLRIDFVYKKSLENLPTQTIVVKTGYLVTSTPELTAMDLLNYPSHVGGLNHIATILSELIEKIDARALVKLANKSTEKAWAQRLGYILGHIETMDSDKQQNIANLLQKSLVKSTSLIPLAPELPSKGCSRDSRWMIIENTVIESDL